MKKNGRILRIILERKIEHKRCQSSTDSFKHSSILGQVYSVWLLSEFTLRKSKDA